MKRREAMALLASAAAWPLASRAQQATPVIGFLSSRSPAESAPLVAAFREGLRESGHFEGRDVQIVFRWAEGRYERLPEMAADLVGQRIALLVSVGGEVTALAAKAATATIPIVFVIGSDAVETGLVASLARPGGNVTGATLMGGALGAKRLELLREMLPDPSVIGFLVNPDHPTARADTAEVHEAAGPLAQPILVVDARTDSDLEHAFKTLAQSRARGLIVNRDGFLNSRRERIMALAARHELPAIYESREHAMAGGLMSYGTSYNARHIRAFRAAQVDSPRDVKTPAEARAYPPGHRR
jgi:putative tryptophan/tyrosine transport system substrate-binding protein